MDSQTVYTFSRYTFELIETFKRESLNPNNPLSFNPIVKPKNSHSPRISKNFKDFFTKYHELQQFEDSIFLLEEEFVTYLKEMFNTNNSYNFDKLKIYQDDFFNEENVKSNILADNYIKKIYSTYNFDLLFFILTYLEKQMFDIVLIQQINNQEDKNYGNLKAPFLNKGIVELLIKNEIEEKLNILYKENTIGFSYICEKLITFYLFIIYLILKNFPFYVLQRNRLEKIFLNLKKFKSFPFPIGSIGMDLFNLLINELYLPGVTIFYEIREKFFLDLIDPKIFEINPEDFIKTISFEKNIFLDNINSQSVSYNEKFYTNLNYYNNNNKIFKLNEYENLSFSALCVYAAYIFYNCEQRKDSEKEEQYLENILTLFEKKLKLKKEKKDEKNNVPNSNKNINISEKNILNNIFNIIDNGLENNFETFIKNIKIINDKLITKAKEIHDSTQSKPKENINLRKFLYHKIKFLELKSEIGKIFEKKFNLENLTKIEEDFDDLDEEIRIQNENNKKIEIYKNILSRESVVEYDEIIIYYTNEFINLTKKYFNHLQEFDIEKYRFSDQNEKNELINHNKKVKIKLKQIRNKFYVNFILTEDELLNFINHLKFWKSNLNPYYHTKLKDIYNEENKKENIKNEDKNLILNQVLKKLERKNLENIVQSELKFNFKLFLIPGKNLKSFCKFLSSKDFIYKTVLYDFFDNYIYNDNIDKILSYNLLEIYLREANHIFNLKIFKVRIKKNQFEDFKNFYGSFHFECSKEIFMIIDENEFNFVSNENIFIDVINIFDQIEEKFKINNIEKYITKRNSHNNFQIFISSIKENTDKFIKENQKEEYFKKFLVNLMNFDTKNLHFNGKKILIRSENGYFNFYPTFTGLQFNCSEVEINFDNKDEINQIDIQTFVDINE